MTYPSQRLYPWPLRHLLLGTLAALSAAQVQALSEHQASSPLQLTGFMSLVGGAVISGDFGQDYLGPERINGTPCPCYIADWGNAGVYSQDTSASPESHIGIQASYKVNSDFSLSGQLVSRGTAATPSVQWAYGSYKISPQWQLQLGRKRIPLYYYSDFQDIGAAYPWVSPPPEIYGWEATNYNGASLRYNSQIANVNLTTSLFTGAETVNDSAYQQLYYAGPNQVQWKHLIGGDLELNSGFLTARLVYMQTQVDTRITDQNLNNSADLQAYGLAINMDFESLFLVSEFTQLSRNFAELGYRYRAPALTLGLGTHIGPWTPLINYAQYTEKSSNLALYQPQSFHRTSVSLRYDLNSSSAIKAQIDRNTDVSHNFGGDTQVLRLSFDHVFE